MFQLRIKDFLKYWIFLILVEVILVHFLYLKFKEYLNYLPLLSSFFVNELPLFIEILIMADSLGKIYGSRVDK